MKPLGRKQTSSQSDWMRTWDAISAAPDRERARSLVNDAAAEVRARCQGIDPHTVAYGWSGGKDSLGLQAVMEAAGYGKPFIVLTNGLEYPAFESWVRRYAPKGLQYVIRDDVNLEWLEANPKWLFPQDSATAAKWFAKVQHTGQRRFVKQHGIEVLALGRRRADGNMVSKHKGSKEYLDKDGFVRYSPIADWTHEDLLHVIAANRMPMPPIYTWHEGFKIGTGPWAARQHTGSLENGWAEVHAIDPQVVRIAADANIVGAREALQRLESR